MHNAGLLSNMELKQGLPHHRDLGISAVVEHSNTKSEGQGLDFSCRTKIFFFDPKFVVKRTKSFSSFSSTNELKFRPLSYPIFKKWISLRIVTRRSGIYYLQNYQIITGIFLQGYTAIDFRSSRMNDLRWDWTGAFDLKCFNIFVVPIITTNSEIYEGNLTILMNVWEGYQVYL